MTALTGRKLFKLLTGSAKFDSVGWEPLLDVSAIGGEGKEGGRLGDRGKVQVNSLLLSLPCQWYHILAVSPAKLCKT